MSRKASTTADEFKAANDQSPVVVGSVIHARRKEGASRRSIRPVWGGRVFAVKTSELRKLPTGYPKWRL